MRIVLWQICSRATPDCCATNPFGSWRTSTGRVRRVDQCMLLFCPRVCVACACARVCVCVPLAIAVGSARRSFEPARGCDVSCAWPLQSRRAVRRGKPPQPADPTQPTPRAHARQHHPDHESRQRTDRTIAVAKKKTPPHFLLGPLDPASASLTRQLPVPCPTLRPVARASLQP